MRKIIFILLIVIFSTGCRTSFEKSYISEHFQDSKIIKEYKVNDDLNTAKSIIEKQFLIQLEDCELFCSFMRVKGFHEGIYLMIALDTSQDRVYKIDVIEHFETEDYGGYITEEWFLNRFKGKSTQNPLETVIIIDKKPNEVVAITGATITSHAVVQAVNRIVESYNKLFY